MGAAGGVWALCRRAAPIPRKCSCGETLGQGRTYPSHWVLLRTGAVGQIRRSQKHCAGGWGRGASAVRTRSPKNMRTQELSKWVAKGEGAGNVEGPDPQGPCVPHTEPHSESGNGACGLSSSQPCPTCARCNRKPDEVSNSSWIQP